MDDSVMRKYTTASQEARHYVQYDQGKLIAIFIFYFHRHHHHHHHQFQDPFSLPLAFLEILDLSS